MSTKPQKRALTRFEVIGLEAGREPIQPLAGEQPKTGGILRALRRSPLVGADLNLRRAAGPHHRHPDPVAQ
jgi:hypothetical protein